jgi:hypothetical protein
MGRLRTFHLCAALLLACGCRPPADAGGEQPEPTPSERPPAEQPPVEQPASCNGQTCESPRQCVSYYGIAGPSGPMFYSCEIPCDHGVENGGCPDGMRCVTIADGPGDVCQASE